MRYTTLIDITQIADVYRNPNARMLYLHLVCIAGYHDDDRDQTRASIRTLAAQTGLSISAVRHALKVLVKAGLAAQKDGVTTVTKWVLTQEITARAKTVKQLQAAEERKRDEKRVEQQYRRMSSDEADAALISTYEAFLKQQADGKLGMVGKRYLDDNKEKYNNLKSKKR